MARRRKKKRRGGQKPGDQETPEVSETSEPSSEEDPPWEFPELGDSLQVPGVTQVTVDAENAEVNDEGADGGNGGNGGNGGSGGGGGDNGGEGGDEGDGEEGPSPRGPGFIFNVLSRINAALGTPAEVILNRGRFNPFQMFNQREGDEPNEGLFDRIEKGVNSLFDDKKATAGGAIMRNRMLGGALQALGGPGKVAIEGAVRAIGATVDKIGEQLNEFNDVNERLAVINSNLAGVTEGNTAALQNSTVGFGLAAKALAELRIAGFEGTNESLVELTTRMKISGQDSAAVIKLAQSLIGIGGLQESSVNSLAETIMESSNTYGVTMDSIVGAVEGLSNNLKSLNIMGGAQAATEITAKLTGILGEEFAPQVGMIMDQLTSTTANLNVQAALGLENLGDLISTGQLTAANMPEILSMLTEGARNASNFVEMANGSRRQLAASFGAQDELLTGLAAMIPALEQSVVKAGSGDDKLAKTITMFNEIVLGDFKQVVASMLPSFQMLLKGLALTIGGGLSAITRALLPILNILMDVAGAVLGAVGFVLQAIGGVFETLYDAISFIPGLDRWFGDGEKNFMDSFEQIGKWFQTQGMFNEEQNQRTILTMSQATAQMASIGNQIAGLDTTDIVRREIMTLVDINRGVLDATDILAEEARREGVIREKELLAQLKPLDAQSDILVKSGVQLIDRAARQIDAMSREEYIEGLRSVFGDEIQRVLGGLGDIERATRENKQRDAKV